MSDQVQCMMYRALAQWAPPCTCSGSWWRATGCWHLQMQLRQRIQPPWLQARMRTCVGYTVLLCCHCLGPSKLSEQAALSLPPPAHHTMQFLGVLFLVWALAPRSRKAHVPQCMSCVLTDPLYSYLKETFRKLPCRRPCLEIGPSIIHTLFGTKPGMCMMYDYPWQLLIPS